MGSQVNFYLTPEDEEAFCRFVLSDVDAVILYRMRLDRPVERVAFPLPDVKGPYCHWFSLWNSRIVPESAITPPGKVPDADNPRGCYDINPHTYPVIDFRRCFTNAAGLHPGRIWAHFEHSRISPEQLKAFRSWFRKLAGWLNKLPYRWRMYRVGPKAKEFFDRGGKAVGYAHGDIKEIRSVGDVSVIRRGVVVNSISPNIERDDGKADLTIEVEP